MPTTKLKELGDFPELLSGGHAACPGCAGPIILRQALLAAQQDGASVVVSIATGCMEVSTTLYPNSAWRVPLVHSAFENAAATISGAEAAYRSLKRQGKVKDDIRFIAFGGDGGTYDIGLQSLSGALERGHNFTYICYDNEAYMNTGIQRSGATPKGAFTTTAPAGKVSSGKTQVKKDLTAIVAAHGIPYVAQAAPHRTRDLMQKVQKAVAIEGPCFLNILAPCPRGWRYEPADTIQLCKFAADICLWPLYEIEDGKLKINYKPREKKPVEEWLKGQGRFKHLFSPKNEHLVAEIQADIDRRWEALLKREEDDKS
ncbi:MAG: thiamine pyrophosphate-dependent enzyme [Candidatus Brocadiia bacterium]|jgi:pyruvate ferredoxin oxidoreductase beta subunit|nr:thiamine pyrophosphate-dependent enzyme [Candidatus Brocadiia bacterium]